MNEIRSDIIVIGAGPAGTTLALMLAGSGLEVVLVDKDRFPRAKVCGDALSGQVVSILKRLPGNLFREFLSTVPKAPSYGIRFVSPGLHSIEIPFPLNDPDHAPGYICPRREFDSFLVSAARRQKNILVLEEEPVVNVETDPDRIVVVTDKSRITGRLAAGADGVHSAVRRQLSGMTAEKDRLSIGIRAYYTGVTGFRPGGFIELWFLRELLPFYFWIFPEAGGFCNAGLALPRRVISEKKIVLARELDRIVKSHPAIAPRFAAAGMAGQAEAHTLPLALPPGPFSGERWILLGDAASLVDPFTGEGIGNAMASAEVAARVIRSCAGKGDFSKEALRDYERQIRRRMGTELRTSQWLHRLAHSPRLFDHVIRRAEKSKTFRDLISASITNENIRKKLIGHIFLGK